MIAQLKAHGYAITATLPTAGTVKICCAGFRVLHTIYDFEYFECCYALWP